MCRADYALGKAIRDGQENGKIYKQGGNEGNQYASGDILNKKVSKVRVGELVHVGDESTALKRLTENVSPAEFETALTEAKAEGNLSRFPLSLRAGR